MKTILLYLLGCVIGHAQMILNPYVGFADLTAPTFASATASGTTLTVNWSEAVSQGAGYSDGDFDLDASVTGNDLGLTYVAGNGTATWTFTIASAVVLSDTLDFDYAGTAGRVVDAAANSMAAIVSASVAHAPTRFYFPSSGAAAVSPAFGSMWGQTGGADRLATVTTPSLTGMWTELSGENLANGVRNLTRQYVSAPLAAQTISGNVRGFIRARYGASSATRFSEIVIRVVSNDGTTALATLKDAQFADELTDVLTNRFTPASGAVTEYACAAGDRLVIEFGAGRYAGSGTTAKSEFRFGDADATADLPENDTSTDDLRPWLEFSTPLTFQ